MDRRVFTHCGEFVLRKVGNESILVPVRNRVGDLDSVYVLTPVAARIWALIDGGNDVDAIVEGVCTDYEVEPAIARGDVDELLASLENAGLIQTTP